MRWEAAEDLGGLGGIFRQRMRGLFAPVADLYRDANGGGGNGQSFTFFAIWIFFSFFCEERTEEVYAKFM